MSVQMYHPTVEIPIKTQRHIYYQLSPADLVEHALANGEGQLSDTGALVVNTAPYTGRSPDDRFFVDNLPVHDAIDWGSVNRPTTPDIFKIVDAKLQAYLSGKDLHVFDGFCGADPQYAMPVRFVTELASHNLFVHQMFVRPTPEQQANFQPEFTVICAPGLKLEADDDHVHSEAAILVNIEQKRVDIAATRYAGEMKKSIFTVMNFLMPDRGVFPMHCSANVGKDGRSALFFGLSGTGKTTLSADPERDLIGDDEHGWSDHGIFNFEGGCYAKTVRLSKENEPEIWDAIRFGAVMENVALDEDTRIADYDDTSITENGRVAYPLTHIPNAKLDGVTGHPSAVIFLTCDAFGVLPPISKLTPEQAQYHFISGYTSKVAGTERGIKEPVAVFSTCFGAPFMPRPSLVYAKLLAERMQAHSANVYLINTGWQGGPYGVGQRVSIPDTRAMVTAALNGSLENVEYWTHPIFNVEVPKTCPGVDSSVLDPRNAWNKPNATAEDYERTSAKLAQMFVENFTQFSNVEHLVNAGPKLPAQVT